MAIIISLKFNWINCTCFGNFNLTKAFLCPGFNVSWTVAVRYSIWMESFPVTVMCHRECFRAQCWVHCCFCSALNTCHRIFLLIVVCLLVMFYCIISGKTTKLYRKILINWRSGKNWQLSFSNNKCSVLSIHDNTLQQPYYLNNDSSK